ncbi:MAG: deoxynucleoside kinase [Anaerolineae bacterium]
MTDEPGMTGDARGAAEPEGRAPDPTGDATVIGPFLMAIEGPIGVGKTTLARLLQPRFGSTLVLEAFEENPFLSDFYGDRARYAFQTQMFFLLSRYRQQQSIRSILLDEPVISDYTFGKDSLFAHLNLAGDELEMYRRLYAVLAERVASPDLVLYLQADTDVLMARIAARDRPYERKMDRDYIADVNEAYERYFANYRRTPLLSLDTNNLNYVQDASALAFVEGKAREALGIGGYQQTLPQMERSMVATIQRPRPEEARHQLGRDVLHEFMSANQALARIGRILVDEEASHEQVLSMRRALHDALGHLECVAGAVGVELER